MLQIPKKQESLFLWPLKKTKYADTGVLILSVVTEVQVEVGILHWLTLKCRNRSSLDQAVTDSAQDGISR